MEIGSINNLMDMGRETRKHNYNCRLFLVIRFETTIHLTQKVAVINQIILRL